MLFAALCLCEVKVHAQIGGCDLCGPSTDTYKNVASGNYSATIGAGCESRGLYSFAVGFVAKSYMTNTIAMGKFVKAQATNSIVVGSGVKLRDDLIEIQKRMKEEFDREFARIIQSKKK